MRKYIFHKVYSIFLKYLPRNLALSFVKQTFKGNFSNGTINQSFRLHIKNKHSSEEPAVNHQIIYSTMDRVKSKQCFISGKQSNNVLTGPGTTKSKEGEKVEMSQVFHHLPRSCWTPATHFGHPQTGEIVPEPGNL